MKLKVKINIKNFKLENFGYITQTLQKPMYHNPALVMAGLSLRKDEAVNNNFKIVPRVDDNKFINKKEVMRTFEKQNKV